MKMKLFSLVGSVAFLLLAGCNTAPVMQDTYYAKVVSGLEVTAIEKEYGNPFEVRQLSNGLQEHTYVQRIPLGNSAIEQTEYVFLVDKGRVVSKDCRRNGTSNFQISQ